MSAPRQLALDLPHRATAGRDDFLVSDCNAEAVAAVDAWPRWPHSGLLLIGPQASGKSHLAGVWQARSGAVSIASSELTKDAVPELVAAGAAIVEDCGPGLDEAAMFHLLNALEAEGGYALLTAREAPIVWRLAMPDLRSRLNRMTVGRLAAPDDRLMEAVMMKLFADRQVEVEPRVLRYLTLRLERSFAAVAGAVERLDRLAIEEQRPVTRALAARIIDDDGPAA